MQSALSTHVLFREVPGNGLRGITLPSVWVNAFDLLGFWAAGPGPIPNQQHSSTGSSTRAALVQVFLVHPPLLHVLTDKQH
jgi:hypothetical protein